MQNEQENIPAVERIALIALAALSLVLRAVSYFRYRFDSDEPQHLHVAWGWTQGLVQYRDLFDNHAPLFHILSAPLLARLGERANILFYMRAPMLVLFAIVLACTYAIARRLYSTRVALWSVVVLSLYPSFFMKSLEYRTDNLWNSVWMITLLIVMTRRDTIGRAFGVGLLLGVATCVSLKTPLLVISLLLAFVGTRLAMRETIDWRAASARAGVFVVGLVIPPSIIALWFAHLHALPNLVYCVFTFNTLIKVARKHVLLLRLLYPVMLVLIFWFGRRAMKKAPRDRITRERTFLWMLLAAYAATLIGFWLLIGPRDYLPVMPLIAIAIAAGIINHIATPARVVGSFVAVVVISILFIGYGSGWFEDETTEYITMMNQVLRLTRPGEEIMDLKGETIYRRRPYYFIFETIGRAAVRKGLLPDNIAESVVAARCYVAQADGTSFPTRGRMFLNQNFMDLGRLRASGQWIRRDGTFNVAVPGPYVVVDKMGAARGVLDGTPYSGPRELSAGPHRFQSAKDERLACLWAPAFQRGFSPFHLQDRDF